MECTELRGDEQEFELFQWRELIFGLKGVSTAFPLQESREALCTGPFIYPTVKIEYYPSGLEKCRSRSQILLLLSVQDLNVVVRPLFL